MYCTACHQECETTAYDHGFCYDFGDGHYNHEDLEILSTCCDAIAVETEQEIPSWQSDTET